MKPKIVQFENGKYAVRTLNFLGYKRYRDLQDPENTRTKNSEYFCDCVGTLDEAENCYGYYIEKVIK
jgi:hypothetical protein